MHKTGKAYANRRSEDSRPIGDFYSTPMSLIWCASDIILKEFPQHNIILEPCAGMGAISRPLATLGYSLCTNDLFHDGLLHQENYLTSNTLPRHRHIITNPPFSLWNEFVLRAKQHCDKFMFIGRLNYLGTKGRGDMGLWGGLKAIYAFNQYVDYQTPYREDGLYHVGAMATAWFLWERSWMQPTIMQVLDVHPYAKLGPFNKKR